MRIFKALKTWHCQDLKSTYCEGLTYTVRDEASLLAMQAAQWEREGKIAWLVEPYAASMSAMEGIGEVTGDVQPLSMWRRLWQLLTRQP
jgi:hypothetical protein